MTMISVRYTIRDAGMSLKLEDSAYYTSTETGEYLLAKRNWPTSGSPLCTLKPGKDSAHAKSVSIVTEQGSSLLSRDLATGIWSFNYHLYFTVKGGLRLALTVGSEQGEETSITVNLVPAGPCDLVKLPPPRNPSSQDPFKPRPKGPKIFKEPERERPHVELQKKLP